MESLTQNKRNTIWISVRQSGHLRCCCSSWSTQLGQKRWWPHGTNASRAHAALSNTPRRRHSAVGQPLPVGQLLAVPRAPLLPHQSSHRRLPIGSRFHAQQHCSRCKIYQTTASTYLFQLCSSSVLLLLCESTQPIRGLLS